jgi:hypothetical protein
MIREHEVIDPPNQGELMKRINAIKAGDAVLKLVMKPSGDELSDRRAAKDGVEAVDFNMSVDSIHDINGDPFVLGFKTDDETTMTRLEVVRTGQPDADERPLNLVVISND